jgi:hypothetical protein
MKKSYTVRALNIMLFSGLSAYISLAGRGAHEHGESVPDLSDLKLPPVAKQEWVFKKFTILAWWPPAGTKTLDDFQRYKEAGFTLYTANPDGGFERALKLARKVGIPV